MGGATAHALLIAHYLDVHGARVSCACVVGKCSGIATDSEGKYGEYTPREFAV